MPPFEYQYFLGRLLTAYLHSFLFRFVFDDFIVTFRNLFNTRLVDEFIIYLHLFSLLLKLWRLIIPGSGHARTQHLVGYYTSMSRHCIAVVQLRHLFFNFLIFRNVLLLSLFE